MLAATLTHRLTDSANFKICNNDKQNQKGQPDSMDDVVSFYFSCVLQRTDEEW